MHVGTQEVAHLDLLSFRVWGRGWGWGWGWGGINNESCISLNASTNHLILLQLFLHTKYREQLPSLPFPPDDVFPPFLIPQFLFLLYLHVSILVRFSSLFIFLFLCFRLLRPLVLPGFPFLSFLCCLPPPLLTLPLYFLFFLLDPGSFWTFWSKERSLVSREPNVGQPARSAIIILTTPYIYYFNV